MAFEQSFIDRVRDSADLVEVIGERISVKKKGSSYFALCPFHNDSKPSLNISPSKQIFKCFACGKGGNVFSFLMEYDHLNFPEAVKSLAEKYNIPLPEEGVQEMRSRDELLPLKDLNRFAGDVYHQYLLRHKKGAPARDYLKSRGLGKEIVLKYQLGYAPNEYQFLRPLAEKSFDPKHFQKSGLFYFREDGKSYDFFRGRLIFPIFSERNEVLGFGGRVLGSGEPKYLNTGETPLFQKKRILYGLNFALKELAKKKTVYVVEGYLDAIACLEAGFPAVAPLGTALTEDHLAKLKRYAERIVLLFDGDTAGRKAASRAAEMVVELGLIGDVAFLPEGEDPFDFLKTRKPEELEKLVESGKLSVYEYLIREKIPGKELSPAEKTRAASEFAPILARIRDSIVKNDYRKKIAAALEIEVADLEKLKERVRPAPAPVAERKPVNTPISEMERRFLDLLVEHPRFIKKAATIIQPEHLEDAQVIYIYKRLLELRNQEGLNQHTVVESFSNPKVRDFLERRLLRTDGVKVADEDLEKAVEDSLCQIQQKRLKRKIADLQGQMKPGLDSEEEKKIQEEIQRLAVEIDHLNQYRGS